MADLPLTGRRILITRAADQSAVFSSLLREQGAEVIEFPTIELLPPLHSEGLDGAIDRLASYAWILFTSANGVLFFGKRLAERGLTFRLPPSLRVCAIGPATAAEIESIGIRVDYVPERFIAEAIVEGFAGMGVAGQKMLLARAAKARDVLPDGLRELGADVDVVETYRTVKPREGSRRLRELLSEASVDAITFTSSSTVSHFMDLLEEESRGRLLAGIAIACIGPVTSRTAREAGLNVSVEAEEYTIPGLVRALADYFEKKGVGKEKGMKDRV